MSTNQRTNAPSKQSDSPHLEKQYEWCNINEQDYLAKRDELKHALKCEPTTARVFIDVAHYLNTVATIWQSATNEKPRDVVRAILDAIHCDPDTKRIVSMRPKPIPLLFVRIPVLAEHDGAFDIQNGEG